MSIDVDSARYVIGFCRQEAKRIADNLGSDPEVPPKVEGERLAKALIALLVQAGLGDMVHKINPHRWSSAQRNIAHLSQWAIRVEDKLSESAKIQDDSEQKSSGKMPDNVDVRDLCHRLAKNRDKIAAGEKSEIEVAREFKPENAANLLRQARRFPHLWKR